MTPFLEVVLLSLDLNHVDLFSKYSNIAGPILDHEDGR